MKKQGWLRVLIVTGAMVLSVAAALSESASVAVADSTSTSCAGFSGKDWSSAPQGWADQCQMVQDSDVDGKGYDRETFVIDPGQGKFLDRDQILAYASDYEKFGLTQNFLWYAPIVRIQPNPASQWSDCEAPDDRAIGVFCGTQVGPGLHTVGQDLADDTLDAIAYGGDWIALGCGNFGLPVAHATPIPVIHGFKFDDANRDGVVDNGESGLGGLTFTLSRIGSLVGQPNASNLATTTSDPSGYFSFALNDSEGPGTYVVTEQYSSDWPNTTPLSQTIVVPEGAGDGARLPTLQFGDRQEIPPVASAAPQQVDQSSEQGAYVTLDGSGSYSPTGDPVTYSWTGPFGTATGERPTVLMPPGKSEVHLTVSDGIKSDPATTTVTVFPPITAHDVSVSGVEGQAVAGTVATFTDPDPNGSATDYAARINWGDGTPTSAGAITKDADGTFIVAGTHTYVDESSYSVSVTITDPDVPYNTATAVDTAAVADAPLKAAGREVVSPNPVDQQLATFTDGNPGGSVADFTATIDWGDGTPATFGQVSGPVGGPFTITGGHTYAALGYKTITIHILDDGGSTATAVDHAVIFEPSGFVIGDENSGLGTHVMYWGAQWWKLNQLSGGTAPAAFKGYASNPGASTTLTNWTTQPGSSSGPPSTVPTFMSVIVSGTISQNGSMLHGDAPHIVIVQTNSGYMPDPGHAGTGTVVAILR